MYHNQNTSAYSLTSVSLTGNSATIRRPVGICDLTNNTAQREPLTLRPGISPSHLSQPTPLPQSSAPQQRRLLLVSAPWLRPASLSFGAAAHPSDTSDNADTRNPIGNFLASRTTRKVCTPHCCAKRHQAMARWMLLHWLGSCPAQM